MRLVFAPDSYKGSLSAAIIEMAAAFGLPLVPQEERNIRRASTYGSGEGRMDAQSAYGKVPYGVGMAAKKGHSLCGDRRGNGRRCF